jgi:hypothetical protein
VQVLASRKKIFIILEFITGGELFDKIVRLLWLTINCSFFILNFSI